MSLIDKDEETVTTSYFLCKHKMKRGACDECDFESDLKQKYFD